MAWEGGWAIAFAIIFPIVVFFKLPTEIGRYYTGQNLLPPVTFATGFWNLVPLVGTLIWIYRTQTTLNATWLTNQSA